MDINLTKLKKKKFKGFNLSCFTLIELLVVMGILGVLMAVTIIVINPNEYLKKARDTNRISDLDTLKTALTLYSVDTGTDYSTPDYTVYVSLPDSNTNCSTWSLPALPTSNPWVYHCSPSTTYKKIDGTGWIPVNLTLMASRPLSALPVDPTNNATYYYTFVKGGSFELTSLTESTQGAANASTDGGVDAAMLEVGTNLTLSPFTHGLVGYWRFDEGTGTTANDSSGNGNTGTLTNGPTRVAGKVGGALSFDGVDDYVNINDSPSINFGTGDFSIVLWIQPKNVTQTAVIMSKRSGAWADNTNKGFELQRTINGIQVVLTDGVSGSQGLNYTSINQDAWSQIIYVFNRNGNLLIYKDGILATTSLISSINGSISNTYPLYIMSRPGGGYYPSGLLDDVRVYNRALSASEVQALYNATK